MVQAGGKGSGGGKAVAPGKVNCFECEHFYVTWDAGFPRGCRAMGFKSAELPSKVVLESSGAQCLKFRPKPPGR